MTELIGLFAGTLTTGAWLPQLFACWRSRSCDDVSWAYLAAMTGGFTAWLSYGLLVDAPAVVVFNARSLVLSGTLAALKASVTSSVTV